MLRTYRLAIFFTVALLPLGCAITTPEQQVGARPEIIFEDTGGVWQPAKGVERNARPTIPDGQRYRASGPYLVSMRDIPRSKRATPNLEGLEQRGGGRMEAPLPDEAMDKLREKARFLSANPLIQDPGAGTASASQAPTTPSTGFDSIYYDECCGGGGNVPPDPELAAGPNHLIAVVNVAFEIYNTNGDSLGGPRTFASFFSSVPACTGVFDPNANYDESEDRFILGIDAGGSDYCIAVSKTGDPTGEWWLYSFQTASRADFFDYPHAGVGDDAIYLGANIFGRRFFKEGRVWAIDKAEMYAGLAPEVVSFGIGSDGTPQPMNLHGWNQGTWPNDGVHYILTDGQSFDGRNYGVWSWINPFGGNTPVKLGEVDLNAATGITAGSPVDAPQQGGGNLQANDWRGQDAEYRDGDIWMTNAQSCNPGSGTVNCVRWAQIDPTTLSVVNAGVYGSDGEYRSFPDLAVDSCGNMMMGYSKTSSAMNPGVYAAGLDSSGNPVEVDVHPGEAVYRAFDGAPYRWGDYTEMTIAPDGSTFWYLGEYARDTGNLNGNWGTWISSFTFGCNGGGNPSPTAIIIDPPACSDLACVFDGSLSTDDGSIDSYVWNFGDGNTGSGQKPGHTYDLEGSYDVSLTVTDNLGATDTTNLSITVDDGINNPPNAVITLISCPDLTCEFDASGSSDSDGTIVSYTWDFGDSSDPGSGEKPVHTYADYGPYTVGLTVEDDGGETDYVEQTGVLPVPQDPQSLTIASIFVDTINRGGGDKSPRATVIIQDDRGNPIGSANVAGDFTGSITDSDSGDTDINGSVTLSSSKTQKGRFKFTFCVSSVGDAAGLSWDGVPACASN